jgi:hypothetical protein
MAMSNVRRPSMPGGTGPGRVPGWGGLVVFVSDLGEKEALLTSNPHAFFTTPHYDGWPIVLVNLDVVDHDELRELITARG